MTTTVGRALVFVTTGPGVDVDTLERAVVGACDDIHGRLVDGGTVRAGVRLDDDPLAAIAREREIRSIQTRAEFSDWWLTHHGPMSIELVPGSVGYQQTHLDPDASQAVADACGLTTRDHDLGETAYFDPEIGKTLFEDEARFVDHSSMIATMARRVVDK